MGFNCGIVGLPNVGKSTLFNALTETIAAEAANYPFCTIEPNTGRVSVPDSRLDEIGEIAKSAQIVPTHIEFVDIAGLVKGASKGEGLGNQFLANIRETDAILHVLRCFEDADITHVDDSIDPIRDAETVETELMLADLESLEKRVEPLIKKTRGNDKDAVQQLAIIERVLDALREGKPARTVDIADDDQRLFQMLQLLTSKPVLYVCNVDEGDAASGNDFTARVDKYADENGAGSIVVSAKIEAEVVQLTDEAERQEFLEALGLEETGLARLIRAGYQLLGLITYFTAGPKEARAWTIETATKAPAAAGVIHTDFEKGFICAETIAYDDFTGLGGEIPCKDAGKMRQEGRDYIVKDGDVILFRFNV
ncbi:MAG: redox-regulated ATPase YchF [Rhodospirillaceae bacterium]|jgi:ribosome-binding ATPase|nr:redox-regulated ATPase YchF [Rhodospirillaceae bacterium]MBT7956028.1 redox-regulated ATPase YchF [Rhodospirillaceae bacterium]